MISFRPDERLDHLTPKVVLLGMNDVHDAGHDSLAFEHVEEEPLAGVVVTVQQCGGDNGLMS